MESFSPDFYGWEYEWNLTTKQPNKIDVSFHKVPYPKLCFKKRQKKSRWVIVTLVDLNLTLQRFAGSLNPITECSADQWMLLSSVSHIQQPVINQ